MRLSGSRLSGRQAAHAAALPGRSGRWLAVGVVAAMTGAGLLAAVAAAPPARSQPDSTVEFYYAGGQAQTVVVPQTGTAEVSVIGGHGGETGGSAERVSGGDGALVTGLLPVTSGELLTVYVASRGADANGRTPGDGGGGFGGFGNASGLFGGAGAGGGGASAIARGTRVLVIAGGGGGGAGNGFESKIDVGGPGGSSGGSHGADPGHDGKGPGHGYGGSGGSEPTENGGAGGNSSYSGGGGGGGGAGKLGGAGGSGGGFGAGGGGGGGAGSGYYVPELANPHVSRGSTSDGNGRVDITWLVSKDDVGAAAGAVAELVPLGAQNEAITGPPATGPAVHLQARTAAAAQLWRFASPGDPPATEIVDTATGLCLGVATLTTGSSVTAGTCDGSAGQEWAQVAEGNGSYRLEAGGAQDADLVLTAQPGSTGLTVGPPRSGTRQDWLEAATSLQSAFVVPVTG
jgi:hypothetical protein